MRTCLFAFSVLLAVQAFGQNEPPIPGIAPPCGQKGLPENAPCHDSKSGKVIHTESPPFVPHQDLKPLPPPADPLVVPKLQPANVTPPDVGNPEGTSTSSSPGLSDHDSTQEPPVVGVKSDNAARQQQNGNFQAGYQLGQALGGMIYQARLRRAINKECYDKYGRGWRLPDGTIISCIDWMNANPRKVGRLASGTSSGVVATEDTSTANEEMADPQVASVSGPDLFEVVMESHRKYLSLHPDDFQHITAWVSVKNLFCREKPNARYIDLEGNLRSCGGMANQSYLMMEQLRKDIVELQSDKWWTGKGGDS